MSPRSRATSQDSAILTACTKLLKNRRGDKRMNIAKILRKKNWPQVVMTYGWAVALVLVGAPIVGIAGPSQAQNAEPSQAQKALKIFMVPKFTGMVLTSALASTISTQTFAQDRGTGATPAAGAKAGATQGTFTTSDAIPWKPVDPKHPGLQMFAVWGNPNEGASEILQKFPAGMDSGWHWHTAAYQGVVIQGKFTHTFEGAAPQTGGPGSVWSQPARQVHDDKCEEGGDCIVVVYFHGKLDFKPVDMKAQQERAGCAGPNDLTVL